MQVNDSNPTGQRPNILVVLLDDMGYSDIGCYGGEIQTPVIDMLASGGVRYSRFYNAAQCCPSRACLLTGLYPHQAGMGDMNARGPESPLWQAVGSAAYLGFRKKGIVTLPEALRLGGYQTFMAGKWHLGDTPDNWPSVRGFDRTFSLVIGASEHFSGRRAWTKEGPIAPFILDGENIEKLPENFYTTDTFTDYALQFIGEATPDKPWFCYLAYTAPHWPLQAHEKDIEKYRGVYSEGPEPIRQRRFQRLKELGLIDSSATLPELDPEITERAKTLKTEEWELWMRTYAAMIDRVDQNLGRVVSLLKARGEFENTLILFMSDNGADTVRGPLWGQVSNTPFRRYKVWTNEGGITTPLVVHWPAGIPQREWGSLRAGYAHFIDLYPTCLDAAGIDHPVEFGGSAVLPNEGLSLLPNLRGESPLPEERPLFWERMGNEAIRRGDWKLVRGYGRAREDGDVAIAGPRTCEWELYYLPADPGETRNLAAQHPEIVTELNALFEPWAKRVGVVEREQIVEIERKINAEQT